MLTTVQCFSWRNSKPAEVSQKGLLLRISNLPVAVPLQMQYRKFVALLLLCLMLTDLGHSLFWGRRRRRRRRQRNITIVQNHRHSHYHCRFVQTVFSYSSPTLGDIKLQMFFMRWVGKLLPFSYLSSAQRCRRARALPPALSKGGKR